MAKGYNIADYELYELMALLPQDRPLYCDSDLWQVRSDDMEGIIFSQNCNENFEEFIRRYIQFVLEYEKNDIFSLED